MRKHRLMTLAVLMVACTAFAQTSSSPVKKELVGKILKLQQPGIESMARALAEQPAAEMLARAQQAIAARIPAEKQEAVAKEIQADVRKYIDETVPMVRDRAVKLSPFTVGALLEDKFTEDELRQVLAFLESPAYVKFQSAGADMQRSLTEKLVADTRASVEPKLRALEQSMSRRLGLPPAGTPAPKPGAKASASK